MEENNQYNISKVFRDMLESELVKRKIDLKYLEYEPIEKLIKGAMTNLHIADKKIEDILLRIEKIQENEQGIRKDRIARQTQKDIKNRFIKGESIDEIKEAGLDITEENLEKLYKKYKDLILLAKAMPVKELSKRRVIRELFENDEEYEKAIVKRNHIYCDNIIDHGLSDMIKAKREQIESRLLSGESAEQIVADRELNVCKEAVEKIQEKVEKENERATKNTKVSKETIKEIKRRFLERRNNRRNQKIRTECFR